MAAPRRYAPPHKQLAELMVAAKARGLGFEAFWQEAVRPQHRQQRIVLVSETSPPPNCVLWPTDAKDRREWSQAIRDTKEGWRRVYEGEEPTRSERAVAQLADLLDELGGLVGFDDIEPALA